jgi:galactitol-specific phosphotransferase system IIB component
MCRSKLTLLGWLMVTQFVLMLTTSCGSSVGSSIKIDSSASSVHVNDEVKVSVEAENVSNLTAFEVHLSFDVNTLEVVETINGSFVAADFVVQNTFDNSLGTIDYAIAQINGAPANGNGTLLEIVFRTKIEGGTLISFRSIPSAPAGILLSDSNGLAIPVTLISGSVVVK